MLIKDKHGNWCNTDYVYAIEWCPYYPTRDEQDKRFRYWTRYKRYKTQKSMLQGLKQLRETEANNKNRGRMSNDGGKTWYETHWLFRPIHLNYNIN